MERTIPVCVVLVLLIGTGLAAGGERRMRWTRPAGDPYVGDVASAIRRFALPSTVEQRFIEQISRSVVTFEVVRTEVERSTFSRAAKDNMLRRARQRSFFTRERLEDLKLPSLLANALTGRIDTTVYSIVHLRRGEECAAMVFGRGRLEQGVTFDPAPGQPEPLRSHQFTVEEGGVRYEIVQPVICDNFCLRRTPIPAARIPEQPAREMVVPSRPARESARVQYHLIPINLFEADAARNVAIVDTIPSRNLGAVRRALVSRRDGLYEGCYPFRVELLNLRFERVMVDQRNGQRLEINNRPEPTD
ncbi:MAG: hypothetical protein U1A28_00690, partial [Patescibacteria group bacterium]|nr:hypothetical protein [Patescibacteria group bacterium]